MPKTGASNSNRARGDCGGEASNRMCIAQGLNLKGIGQRNLTQCVYRYHLPMESFKTDRPACTLKHSTHMHLEKAWASKVCSISVQDYVLLIMRVERTKHDFPLPFYTNEQHS